MAKEINTGSKMNGLFRFNEKDYVAGFYAGTQSMKHGEAIILKSLDGQKAVGVPNYTTIKGVTEKIEEGDFLLLMYKGNETSKGGTEYMNVQSRAWRLEDSEKKEWDDEKCNVKEILDLLPEYDPDPEDVGSEAGDSESIPDDDLPF